MSSLDKETHVQLLRARWRKDWRAWQQTMELRERNGLPSAPWMDEVTANIPKEDSYGG